MTIQNLPFLYLIWITVGVVLILIGIFILISHINTTGNKVSPEQSTQTNEELEGILSYFLQEEEKKNEGFREMLENYAKEIGTKVTGSSTTSEVKVNPKAKNNISDITVLADQGLSAEEIAKQLGKGVGEVNLILSLYTMR